MTSNQKWTRSAAARVTLLLACAALPVSGCGGIQDGIAHSVAAPPLDLDAVFGGNAPAYCNAVAGGWRSGQPAPTSTTVTPPDVACAQAVVHDSLVKCHAFMNGVVGDQVGWDVGLDVAGIAGSAVGAVVSPAAVARGFSAASSIFTGSRAAIDSDIYAKAGRGAFAKAIQSTYYTQMIALKKTLSATTGAPAAGPPSQDAIDSAEINHASCSLDAAESTINSTLGNASSQKTPAADNGAGDKVDAAKAAPKQNKSCSYKDTAPGDAIKPSCD